MDRSNVIDLDGVRRRCGQLTARQLCLPAGIDPLEREHVDTIVRRRALPAGARLFHQGGCASVGAVEGLQAGVH